MTDILYDGRKLFYKEQGEGPRAFLFIHGTGGNHVQLDHEFNYFAKRGRAISFDLRGHGQSDQSDEPYSIESFAGDIHWICEQLKVSDAVVVGASMGGNIAIELAAQFPQLVSGVVLLDSAFLYSEKVLGLLHTYTEGMKSDQKSGVQELLKNSCLETDGCTKVLEKMYLETASEVWVSCFKEMLRWDVDKVKDQIQKIKVPMLYIEAENRIVDLDTFKELYPNLKVAKVVGSGHLISLEVPEQVNPMIERFCRVLL